VVNKTDGKQSYSFDLAKNPIISNDGNWVAMQRTHPFAKIINKGEKETLNDDMILLNATKGDTLSKLNVKEFRFSNNSNWLAVLHHEDVVPDSLKNKNGSNGNYGTDLELLNLGNLFSNSINNVIDFSIDSTSTY